MSFNCISDEFHFISTHLRVEYIELERTRSTRSKFINGTYLKEATSFTVDIRSCCVGRQVQVKLAPCVVRRSSSLGLPRRVFSSNLGDSGRSSCSILWELRQRSRFSIQRYGSLNTCSQHLVPARTCLLGSFPAKLLITNRVQL